MSPSSSRFQRELSRFFKFSVVGTAGAVVDFGTFNLLLSVLHVPYLIAQGISFTFAIMNNFLLNRYWTYPDSRSKPVARQAVQLMLVNAVGLMIRTPVLALTESPMIRFAQWLISTASADSFSLAGWVSDLDPSLLGRNFALALAVIIVLFWNFGINRIWTYSDAP